MSNFRQVKTLGVFAACVALVGACAESSTAPSNALHVPTVSPTRLAAQHQCDPNNPVHAFGLTHMPSGSAQLAVTAGGALMVSNLGTSASDGTCTILPSARHLEVTLTGNAAQGFGFMTRGEWFSVILSDSDGWRQSCEVRGTPGRRMQVRCSNPAVLGWRMEYLRNGVVVRSQQRRGPSALFTVPALALTAYSYEYDTGGVFRMEGVEQGNVLGGVVLIPVIDVIAPLPTGITGMVTLLQTQAPTRAYGFFDIWTQVTAN